MKTGSLVLSVAVATLLATVSWAQQQQQQSHGSWSGWGNGSHSSPPPPPGGHGNTPPPPPPNHSQSGPPQHQWSGSPPPQNWSGGTHTFNPGAWRGGHWWHGSHGGHWGWWWIAGPDFYYYDQPFYPAPDPYTPPGEVPGRWYWCDAFQAYYPYVTYCPSGWVPEAPDGDDGD